MRSLCRAKSFLRFADSDASSSSGIDLSRGTAGFVVELGGLWLYSTCQLVDDGSKATATYHKCLQFLPSHT